MVSIGKVGKKLEFVILGCIFFSILSFSDDGVTLLSTKGIGIIVFSFVSQNGIKWKNNYISLGGCLCKILQDYAIISDSVLHFFANRSKFFDEDDADGLAKAWKPESLIL